MQQKTAFSDNIYGGKQYMEKNSRKKKKQNNESLNFMSLTMLKLSNVV